MKKICEEDFVINQKVVKLGYVDQYCENLYYVFAERALDVDNLFKVVCQKKIITLLGTLTVSIIGESHAVMLKHDKLELTEALACIRQKKQQKIRAQSLFLGGIKDKLRYKYRNDFFAYSFQARVEKKTERQMSRLLETIRQIGFGCALFFQWEKKEKNKDPHLSGSFTHVRYDTDVSGRINVTTSHFYVNQMTLVSTSTFIRLRPEK